MLVAMAVDAVLGWPGAMFARIGHPVSWLGSLIGALDARWNRPSIRQRCGAWPASLPRWS